MSTLLELQQAVGTVAERVGPSTVSVGRDRRGAGVVIAAGQVLTNAHNLRDRTIQVTFADGRSTQGTLVAADPDGDLAVVAVDTGAVTPVEWSSAAPELGQAVFATALGRHGLRVTAGQISGVDQTLRGPRGRRITGTVEHTAPLARGSSGGPLADAAGHVVAINTHRVGDGFTIALPLDEALQTRIARLAAGESASRPRLGVAVAPSHVAARLRRSVGLPDRDGLLVRGVEEGSPAATAGILVGDLLVTAAGTALRSADELWAVLDGLGETTGLTIGFVRGTDERSVEVSFAAPSDDGA